MKQEGNEEVFSKEQIDEIVGMLQDLGSDTKIYFGCDSVKFRKDNRWFARYATVVIIHRNGKNGCKLFSHTSVEPDYDVKKNRPKTRMMNESMKVCAAYNQLIPFIEELAEITEDKNGNLIVREFDVEVHLDIATDPKHGSSCAAVEAAGYVLGMTGLPKEKIKLKPDAFAASFGADGIGRGFHQRG
jgi:predicted RNase H-related nuclease YkuK (DUF458 family)